MLRFKSALTLVLLGLAISMATSYEETGRDDLFDDDEADDFGQKQPFVEDFEEPDQLADSEGAFAAKKIPSLKMKGSTQTLKFKFW